MVDYAPYFFSQNILEFKIVEKTFGFFGFHTFGHSVCTVRKIFDKVFTTFFLFGILYLTSVNRHNPIKLWPQ